jgi:anti-anti-sigma regulatory factor/PAS domain-containing protein
MIGLLATFLIIIVCTSLATLVVTRAWDYFPSRLAVLVIAVLVLMNILTTLRAQTSDPSLIYMFLSMSYLTLAVLSLLLLLLFSALFLPEWWSGSRPIRWIALPYIFAFVMLVVDLFGGTGQIVDGLRMVNGVYRFNSVSPGGPLMLNFFTIGWLVELGILGVAFWRERRVRLPIVLLFVALIIAVVANVLQASIRIELLRGFSNLLSSLPLTLALAYAVLRTRLLTPTRAALDLAIEGMSEAVLVLDATERIVYINRSAQLLGFSLQQPLDAVLPGGNGGNGALTSSQPHTLAGHRVILSRTPLADIEGNPIGALLLGRDVTELEQRNEQLACERSRLAAAVQQLEAEKHERMQLAALVRELALPALPVLDGVLVLPLVGSFDTERQADFIPVLLASIQREHARHVLIDLTGLPAIDAEGAAALLQSVHAADLLGARCTLVGVRPQIAQALVELGLPLDGVDTSATLQQAVQREIRRHAARRAVAQAR